MKGRGKQESVSAKASSELPQTNFAVLECHKFLGSVVMRDHTARKLDSVNGSDMNPT